MQVCSHLTRPRRLLSPFPLRSLGLSGKGPTQGATVAVYRTRCSASAHTGIRRRYSRLHTSPPRIPERLPFLRTGGTQGLCDPAHVPNSCSCETPLSRLFNAPLRVRAGMKISALVRTLLGRGTTYTNEDRSSVTDYLTTPTTTIRKIQRNSLRPTHPAAPPYSLECSASNRMVPERLSQRNNYLKFS
jgi:hypothetical protein